MLHKHCFLSLTMEFIVERSMILDVFSLSITKPINMVYGGFCATNSKNSIINLIAIRNNGVNAEPENARLELPTELGLNLKPSDLHASIGLINLNSRAKRIKSKKIFDYYKKNINNQKKKLLES